MEGILWLDLAKFIQILYTKDINTDNNHAKEHNSPPPWKTSPPPLNHPWDKAHLNMRNFSSQTHFLSVMLCILWYSLQNNNFMEIYVSKKGFARKINNLTDFQKLSIKK